MIFAVCETEKITEPQLLVRKCSNKKLNVDHTLNIICSKIKWQNCLRDRTKKAPERCAFLISLLIDFSAAVKLMVYRLKQQCRKMPVAMLCRPTDILVGRYNNTILHQYRVIRPYYSHTNTTSWISIKTTTISLNEMFQ